MKSDIFLPGSEHVAYRRTVTNEMQLPDGRTVGKITVDYNTLFVYRNGSGNWQLADWDTQIARQQEGIKRMAGSHSNNSHLEE